MDIHLSRFDEFQARRDPSPHVLQLQPLWFQQCVNEIEHVKPDTSAVDLGENIADLGGLTVSLNAYRKTAEGKNLDEDFEGLTRLQRFFISYGQIWKQVIRPQEIMKRVKEDVHSLGRFRVNGVVRNMPEFYDAFKITDSEDLYLKEDDRAVIW